MSIRKLLLAALCTWLLAACGSQPGAEDAAPRATATDRAATTAPTSDATPSTASATATPAAAREDRLLTPPPHLPTVAAPASAETPVVGEVPTELLTALLDDLQRRIGVAADAITVQRAEAVVWPDGSLGCPQPGTVYTQAPVPGYHVTLSVLGERYEYHTNRNGYFTLCEAPTSPGAPAPAGTSSS